MVIVSQRSAPTLVAVYDALEAESAAAHDAALV
jgi:hypothetical protein